MVLRILILLATTRIALAQTPAPDQSEAALEVGADRAFAEGRDLLKERKFAEACAKFELSHRLDPQFGTQHNIALCKIGDGKLLTAWNIYRQLAKADTNEERRRLAGELAAKMVGRIPKVKLDMADQPDGVKVTLDGHEVALGVEVPVDSGDHVIVVGAPGYRELRTSVAVSGEWKTIPVALRLEREAVASAPSRRVLYGKIAVIGGGALVAIGLGFGIAAYSKWQDVEDCITCDRAEETSSVRVLGNVSTAFVVTGLVAGGIGGYLWYTGRTTIAPSTDRIGLVVAGEF